MNSDLFTKLSHEPQTEYSENELYESIKTNLMNLMNEKNPTVSEMMQKFKDGNIAAEQELHEKLFGRLQVYEPRLHEVETDFILSPENLILQIKGMVLHDDTLHTFTFMIPVNSGRI